MPGPSLRWLFSQAHHVIDRLLDQVVRGVGAATLRWHYARGALEAVQGMVVKGCVSLRDAGAPGGLVARFRGTSDTGAVAGAAGLLE